jgi:hypothetical protein
MRFLALLLAAPLIAACGVPEVSFYDAAPAPNDGIAPGPDGAGDAQGNTDGDTDAPSDADAASDGPAGDGFTDYCKGPDGGVPPLTLGCCPGGTGEVCSGGCKASACQACGACAWPNICCTTGANGACKPSC